VQARDLVWDGCINVRDLGGLPTEDGGQTVFGSVIRADTLGYLTREGWEALLASGVTRIVDLREQFEIDNDPPRDLDVEVVHVPVLDHYDEERWLEVQAESEAAPTHTAATEIIYLRFLEHCRPRLVEAFEVVATAPGLVVFHCHAGKDRTGLVAALLLRLAGVSIEDIADDYAISRIRLQPRHEQWLASAESQEERARIERITATPAAAMQAVLEAIDRDYGGVEQYLLGGGLAPETLTAAWERLRCA
jgi:protein tyrosine/serine phosphatase